MKKHFLLLSFLFVSTISIAQTFAGNYTDNLQACFCTIRINRDSTVNFIYQRDHNGIYGEHIGTIKKLNDTVYHISAVMSIGQFYMKSRWKDSFYIALDSNIARQLDKIGVDFAGGKFTKQLQGYDSLGKPRRHLIFPVDKSLFNESGGTRFATITINRKNFLSDNFLNFRIPFGSAASFQSGDKIEFDVVIKGGRIWTIGHPPSNTGYFKLQRRTR